MPTSKRKRIKTPVTFYWLLPLVFTLGLGVGYLLWGTKMGTSAGFTVSADDDPSLGPKNAPVTIIEFGDYQCGYCKKWYDEVFSQLLASYPNKIRFVYRDFPIFAPQAAAAANCAGEQDAYWEFHDALFSEQYGLDTNAFMLYASALGLDISEFSGCLQSGRAEQEVQDDYKYGYSIGVQSTPTFFINNRQVLGAQPFEVFKQIIDEELNK